MTWLLLMFHCWCFVQGEVCLFKWMVTIHIGMVLPLSKCISPADSMEGKNFFFFFLWHGFCCSIPRRLNYIIIVHCSYRAVAHNACRNSHVYAGMLLWSHRKTLFCIPFCINWMKALITLWQELIIKRQQNIAAKATNSQSLNKVNLPMFQYTSVDWHFIIQM